VVARYDRHKPIENVRIFITEIYVEIEREREYLTVVQVHAKRTHDDGEGFGTAGLQASLGDHDALQRERDFAMVAGLFVARAQRSLQQEALRIVTFGLLRDEDLRVLDRGGEVKRRLRGRPIVDRLLPRLWTRGRSLEESS
jgi:hypothetical protein